ncbi:hypothetical protein GOODEAATRI_027617, partial [Goodea atripinnis]
VLCSLRMVMTCAPLRLSVKHLREGLSDYACSNCNAVPQAVQLARLSSVELPANGRSLPSKICCRLASQRLQNGSLRMRLQSLGRGPDSANHLGCLRRWIS